jgi:hypothetical protein
LLVLGLKNLFLRLHAEMGDEFVELHKEIPALPLVERASLLEVLVFVLLQAFDLKIRSGIFLKGLFRYFIDVSDLVQRKAAMRIFLEIIRVCIVMILHTLGTNGSAAALTVALARGLRV